MHEPFPDPRVLLRRHGLQAKKSFGQNFLLSERAYRAIVDATVRDASDWVVEIGAGLGTLTARLAERVADGKVIAVERDRDMVAVLRAELEHYDNVEITEADALSYDLSMAARWAGGALAVCGNLPYNIASQILFRIIEARAHITHAVVMLQREVADRLLARPGTRTYSALTVMITAYADVSSVVRVARGGFWPPPKVESTVVRLTPLPEPRADLGDPDRFSGVVHAAFGQRRKTLRNALRARYPHEAVDRALEATGIDGDRRGETLDIGEFAALTRAL